MKILLLISGLIVLLVGSTLSYPEAITIMKGDYMFSRWIGITETNKDWAFIFMLGLIGGCLGYIFSKLPKLFSKGVG